MSAAHREAFRALTGNPVLGEERVDVVEREEGG
jgi:hypothetical protein